MRHASGDVGPDSLRRRLLDVVHVRELVVALGGAGGAPEVVERDGGDPALGEAQRELLVEAVEAADVRQDHDTRACRLVGRRRERGEAVPVGRLEDEVVVRDRRPGDDGDRRQRFELEAHGVKIREARGSGDAVQDAVRDRPGGVAVTVMPHEC